MMIKTVLAKLFRPSSLAALAGFAILVDILYCKALGAVGAPGKASLLATLRPSTRTSTVHTPGRSEPK